MILSWGNILFCQIGEQGIAVTTLKEQKSITNLPMVSIIIPVYNGSNYLKVAIDSALAQDYPNIEVIVINDGSQDEKETERIARSYGDKIRYFAKENGGVSTALNLGIREMKGEYFSWLSHDDIYSPTKVSDAVDVLARHGRLGERCLAYTRGVFISATGETLFGWKKISQPERLYSGEEVLKMMGRRGSLNGCGILIPKEAFKEVGFFDEELRFSQDSLMWYRIFLKGFFLISDDHCNVKSRIHKAQVTNIRRDLYEHDAEIIARDLAGPLMNADPTGKLLYLYIKRLTRSCCQSAISYLMSYAEEVHAFSRAQRARLIAWRSWGRVRYRCVKAAKRILAR